MIAVDGVSVRRASTTLVADVSLTVEPGEVLALVGPNGAGKSTLLRVMGGDEIPVTGHVRYRDREASLWSRDDLSRFRAVLPQHSTLDFDFTVEEVVAMGRAPWRHESMATQRSIAAAALRIVDLESLARRRYPSLSGGEQQRVHLARVITQCWPGGEASQSSAGALLLDEPVSSLDPQHQHRTLQIARAMAARGVAVLVVLHDLNLAVQYADRIALLCKGRLAAVGPARTVLDEALLGDVYGTCFDIVSHPCGDCPLVLARPSHWAR